MQVDPAEDHLELVKRGRAKDHRGHEGPLAREGQGHLHRIQPVFLRDLQIGVHRIEHAVRLAPAQIPVDRHARSFGQRAILVFAGQQPRRQRRVRQHPDIFVVACLGHVGISDARQQRIFVLDRNGTRAARAFSGIHPLGQPPSAFVAQPEGADGAAGHLVLQRAKAVFHMRHRLGTVLRRGVILPVLAEHVAAAIGPVELVEIDVIGVEPLQRSFKRAADRIGRNPRAVTHRSPRA